MRVGKGTYALEPRLLESPEVFDFWRRDVVVRHDGKAPCIAAYLGRCGIEGCGRVALEMRERFVQRYLDVFEDFA